MSLCYLADFEAASKAAEQGLRVNPYSPDIYLDVLATVHFLRGNYQECLNHDAQIASGYPESPAWRAACHGHLGNHAAAKREAAAFVRAYRDVWAGDPKAGPADYVRWILDVNNPFARDEDRERLAEGLRLAGLTT